MIRTSLILEQGADIRKYISIHDVPVMIAGVLASQYPNGISTTRQCLNTLVPAENNGEKGATYKCDFVVTANVKPAELIKIDWSVFDKNMLETISKKSANTVTVDEAREYQLQINSLMEKANIHITITAKRIYVKLPKNDTDTQFLSSFRFVQWDKNNLQWIIPNYGKNLKLIQSYFDKRSVDIHHEEERKITSSSTPHAETGKFKVYALHNRILRIYTTSLS